MTTNNPTVDYRKVCPVCAAVNEPFAPYCENCSTDLSNVDLVDGALLIGGLLPVPPATYQLQRLSLDSRQADGSFASVPDSNGTYVIGRSEGTWMPDINVKPLLVPYQINDHNSPNFGQKQYGVSRLQAVMVRRDNELLLFRHPQASVNVVVNGVEIPSTDVTGAVRLNPDDVIELGEIFIPGQHHYAPGVILQLVSI